uniref:Uncharacterized protein n=1 Tax=viral metagenome TaxID=1070528 RepID=A0A6M3K3K4_9ZZZZ
MRYCVLSHRLFRIRPDGVRLTRKSVILWLEGLKGAVQIPAKKAKGSIYAKKPMVW